MTSFEKFVADCELLDMLLHQFTPVEIDEASLAFDAHDEVRQGGHFFGAEHTLERFRDCFWRPTVATTDNISPLVARRLARPRRSRGAPLTELLERYEQPPLDEAVASELVEFVERRAVELGDTISVR